MQKRVGRYEIIQPIASGGMATVYLGRARGADFEGFERLVAVKAMHPHIAQSSDYLAMFFDEATLAARIRHPNVVATLDIIRDKHSPMIVMEFIEGPSLHRVLRIMQKVGQRLPIGIGVRIAIDVLAGLHAAHELANEEGRPLNLVHRDVSPQNVLIGCDGVVRLTDFGVAHAEERMARTRTGQLKGKIYYLAPEQVRGEAVDRRADVFAAGALLWEMLSGKRLLDGKNEAELIYKLLEGPEQSPMQLNAEVPAEVDAVCMKALASTADARFATTGAFAEALEDAAEEAGVPIATSRKVAAFVADLAAHDPAPPGKGPRWVRATGDIEVISGLSDGSPVVFPHLSDPELPRPHADQPTTPTIPLDIEALREESQPVASRPDDEPKTLATAKTLKALPKVAEKLSPPAWATGAPARPVLPGAAQRPPQDSTPLSGGTPLTSDNALIASLVPKAQRKLAAPMLIAGAILLVVTVAVFASWSDSAPVSPTTGQGDGEKPAAQVDAPPPAETSVAEPAEDAPAEDAPAETTTSAPPPAPAPAPHSKTEASAPRPTGTPPKTKPSQPAPEKSGKRYHPSGL